MTNNSFYIGNKDSSDMAVSSNPALCQNEDFAQKWNEFLQTKYQKVSESVQQNTCSAGRSQGSPSSLTNQHQAQNQCQDGADNLTQTIPHEVAKKLIQIHRENLNEGVVFRDNTNLVSQESIKSGSSSPTLSKHVQCQPNNTSDISFHPDFAHHQYSYTTRKLPKEGVKRRLFQSEFYSDSEPTVAMENISPIDISFLSPRKRLRDYVPSPVHWKMYYPDRQCSRSPYPDSHDALYPVMESRRSPKRHYGYEMDWDEDFPLMKRKKADDERATGLKYLKQLKSDISSLRQNLRKPETEVNRPSDCACAVMEKQFLEMAESAYRSIRRIDDSPRGFEQFRRELIQTNDVIKDSLDVLADIKRFCEHNI